MGRGFYAMEPEKLIRWSWFAKMFIRLFELISTQRNNCFKYYYERVEDDGASGDSNIHFFVQQVCFLSFNYHVVIGVCSSHHSAPLLFVFLTVCNYTLSLLCNYVLKQWLSEDDSVP